MGFSRATALSARPDETTLTRDMVGIGMNFAARANPSAPIEETLVHASAAGADEHDLRVLSVLTTWVGVHHAYINADRLVRCVSMPTIPFAALTVPIVRRRAKRFLQGAIEHAFDGRVHNGE